MEFIADLSHSVDAYSPSWNGKSGFNLRCTFDYDDAAEGQGFRVQSFEGNAGIGTHIDAPAHCFPEGKTVDEIPLNFLVVPAFFIDVSIAANERYRVSVQDIISFEEKYGAIPGGSFVAFNTGWAHFWDTPKKYRNNYLFPTVTPEAALLLQQKGIVGMGIDTLSP
ncbi:MAG: cyclase family protein, partial [Candidatus Dependentiae bacterium]